MVSAVAQTFDLQVLWHYILGRKNRALLLESSCSVSEAGASSGAKLRQPAPLVYQLLFPLL